MMNGIITLIVPEFSDILSLFGPTFVLLLALLWGWYQIYYPGQHKTKFQSKVSEITDWMDEFRRKQSNHIHVTRAIIETENPSDEIDSEMVEKILVDDKIGREDFLIGSEGRYKDETVNRAKDQFIDEDE